MFRCGLLFLAISLGRTADAAPAASGAYGLPPVKFGGRYSLVETIRMLDSSETTNSVGYSVQGELSLEYIHKHLILAKIDPVKLHITSRKVPTTDEFVPHTSKLDEMENGPFLIQVEEGVVKTVYIVKTELPQMISFKKGIAGLFQFQTKTTTATETDVSGECEVKYSAESNRINKDKTDCKWPNMLSRVSDELWGNKITSSRKTSISLTDQKIVDTVEAIDEHVTQSSLSSFANVGVTAGIKLKVLDPEVNKNRLSTADVTTVSQNIKSELGVEFIELTLEPETITPDTNIMKFADVVDKFNKNLQNSELGTSKSAWALVKSVRSMKNTKTEDLYKVLTSKKHKNIRHQLIDIFGTVQTNETHSAALKFLRINQKDMDLDLCERYLWALSTSPNIKNHVVREIYELVKTAKHPNENLWQTLVLTLPAMAYRYNERCGNCDPELIENTVQFLNESMIACKADDDGCQTIYLRGLLNIPSDIMKTTLVEKALNSKGRVGVVAMRFIEKLGPKNWDGQVLKAAEQVYLGNHTYDSSARCIALDILLKSQPNDLLLTRIISILERPYSTRELKEYLFQRLNELSETDPQFGQRVKRIIKSNGYNHYNYIAQGGFSTAFRRDFMAGGALSTAQEVVGGLLKRGNVYVNLEKNTGMEPVFTLGLFSTGLSSFMSSSEEETEDEGASGGLELNVLGVGLRPFVFFNGHGELMGHVWSGTASSLTPAFQALILLEDEVVKIPLAIGYYASVTTEVGASVDLSGKIEISLWNRNAESLVQNKAGLAFDTRIDIDTSFVKTTAEYNIFSEPEVHLESYIEFSGEIALCLQFQQPSSTIRYNTYRIERIPGSKHKLRRSRYRNIAVPGKTYSLNAKNNEMCNVILSE
ncbi:hypothetical protein GE061_015919 [Apolygus lucorum]|uniref:Uncharacterized protein n=1 Tax=Apolygus lucorum TaxID=248454 RepID=A0A6A4JN62_APOLU|nr:hypothetical protein GE061_015919 [Apolygus lucorum]